MSCRSSSRVFSQSSRDGSVQFIPLRYSLAVGRHVCAFSTGNATISRRGGRGRGRGSGHCWRHKLKLPCRDAPKTHYFVVGCNCFYKNTASTLLLSTYEKDYNKLTREAATVLIKSSELDYIILSSISRHFREPGE
jgi:hypothetical protein